MEPAFADTGQGPAKYEYTEIVMQMTADLDPFYTTWADNRTHRIAGAEIIVFDLHIPCT